MPYILTSKASSRPLLVFLASGSSVRLSPRQESEVLADVDVLDVPAIERLERQGLLDVRRVDDGDEGGAPVEDVAVEDRDGGQEPAPADPEAPAAAPARGRARTGRTRQSSEPRASAEDAPAEPTAP
ncbi:MULTISPECIES: hypothetical protein [unclassified Geodermatophilus]|uniref:hypothetical protein n=1 Tax=unclassified Geodermatophilus TaxID=2637632 RepID=UPI003EEB738F